jgi:cephalosporin hydroxylase
MLPTDQLPLQPLPSWDSEATWRTFEDGNFHGVYRGAELQKSDDDLDRYTELVQISHPDVIIETGTRYGGSALWFRHELGLDVITIDIEPKIDQRHDLLGITSIRGSSQDLLLAARVIKQLREDKGVRVMVSLDADHHADMVDVETALWADAVSPGCYLVIEDACFDMWSPERARVGGAQIPERGGPLHSINRCADWLRGRSFWRDEAVEALSTVSHSPCGWWRRGE